MPSSKSAAAPVFVISRTTAKKGTRTLASPCLDGGCSGFKKSFPTNSFSSVHRVVDGFIDLVDFIHRSFRCEVLRNVSLAHPPPSPVCGHVERLPFLKSVFPSFSVENVSLTSVLMPLVVPFLQPVDRYRFNGTSPFDPPPIIIMLLFPANDHGKYSLVHLQETGWQPISFV